jgi:CopA family copper-resistance protein
MKNRFLGLVGVAAALACSAAAAGTYNLVVDQTTVNFTGKERRAMAINGSIPAPALRWREGEEVTINVTNKLKEDTSIHWHGIILPNDQDGVPGMTFAGIKPGETFTYRFTVKQSGTYWYHSHSGMQEAIGMYGPLLIEPAKPEAYRYDREYVVMLSDWKDEAPHRIMANLKKMGGYYNYNKRTLVDLFRDLGQANGWNDKKAVMADRLAWAQMRMEPTDLADVTGFTFLTNGHTPEQNWTALFKLGEKVRLRLINGSAMSYYDFRIPGLKMTVVQADGQDVEPVVVDELRIAVAETYDVIVEPDNRAYTLFAESFDRTGYARGTLAPQAGMSAVIPQLREPQLLTMADMGMDHGDHGSHGTDDKAASAHAGHAAAAPQTTGDHGAAYDAHGSHGNPADAHAAHGASPSMTMSHHGASNDHGRHAELDPTLQDHAAGHGQEMHSGHEEAPAMGSPSSHPGHGASTPPVGRSLTYADLRASYPKPEFREPDREIVIRLTGNMERFIWSINDKKFSEAPPIQLKLGERVRFKFVNETMMNHPMHLHGMWMEPVNGQGEQSPRKHVVNIAPGQTYYVDVNVDAPGDWAFHCHLMYHMDAGMFRMVTVAEAK